MALAALNFIRRSEPQRVYLKIDPRRGAPCQAIENHSFVLVAIQSLPSNVMICLNGQGSNDSNPGPSKSPYLA
jgi:hypothetical protein